MCCTIDIYDPLGTIHIEQVRVEAYTRKDGRRVAAHFRNPPKRRSGRKR